ncbi:DCL family protein [Aeromonas hydrophila]|uniref:DCL family protein n=1 Tax=Aeromonas hydrophila TaxID=644 RepID=UPI002B051A41|nr:DCL family protein [Aeromonas hydrophila]
MAKPIVFGRYHFNTKKSATEESRNRINQYEAGQRLRLEDEHFFVSLFTLHSEFLEKKGVGIDYITVERDFHNNRCLYIHRVDGTSIDCSWVHCIQPASKKTVVSMAFRRAIKEIIMAYKSASLNQVDTCPIIGTKLTYENSHVSYLSPSFDDLLAEFLQLHHIDIESVALTNPKPVDTDQRGQITNQELLNDWRTFHKRTANLQLLSAEANLRRVKS